MMLRKAVLSVFVTSYVLVTCPMQQDLTKPETDSLTEAIARGPVLQDPLLAASFVLDAPVQAVTSQKRKIEPEAEAAPVCKAIKKAQHSPSATIALLKRNLASQRRAKRFFLERSKERLGTIDGLESENDGLRAQVSQLEAKIRALEGERNASTFCRAFSYLRGSKG